MTDFGHRWECWLGGFTDCMGSRCGGWVVTQVRCTREGFRCHVGADRQSWSNDSARLLCWLRCRSKKKMFVEGTRARSPSSHGSREHHLQTPSSSSIPKTYITAIHRTISAYRTAHAACTSDFPSISIPAVSGPSLLHDCAAICGDWRLDDAHRAGSCYVYPGTRTSIIHA